jgi:hypothetical protein
MYLMEAMRLMHPNPDRYCPECFMRRENCACKQASVVANHKAWALKNGRGNPIRDVWSRRDACRRLKRDDVIQAGDRCWCIAVQIGKEIVDSLGGPKSRAFMEFEGNIASKTPYAWHPVSRKDIGKRPRDLIVSNNFGRPRSDWEFIEP